MKNNNNSSNSIGTLLLIVFLVLKLTGNIDWSWWWVLSPLWIGAIIVLVLTLILMIIKK